ncbi:MAG: hypothetical protein COB46_07840 [Rhodospirillaceae bacterium]|nr:MAG: hypothetical protein COB46_07840 [Rhodospirillaceae bacterium]
MIDNEARICLKMACQLFGGQKAIAMKAMVEKSNFGKWLNGQPTLSKENVESVLASMGLPDMHPNSSTVHIWNVDKLSGIDFSIALKLYFPDGGEIARTFWPYPIWSDENPYEDSAFIYALTDGHVRAILRHRIKKADEKNALLKSHLKWRNGTVQSSPLQIHEKFKNWTSGIINSNEFNFVWENLGLSPEMQSVIAHIESSNLSVKEAKRRLDIEYSEMDLMRINRNEAIIKRRCIEQIRGDANYSFHDIIIPANCCFLAKKQKGASWIKKQGWDISEAEWLFGKNWLERSDKELDEIMKSSSENL